ncbi:MAG: hypothetical protein P8Y12_00545 [Gammaproteobacteria bacterium]
MPENISLLEDLRIIMVDSFGEVTSAELRASLARVIELHSETGFDCVLVDSTHDASYPPNFPLFEFGSNLALGVRHLKIAVATSPGTHAAVTLVKQIAASRGLIIELFNSVEEALNFLRRHQGSSET